MTKYLTANESRFFRTLAVFLLTMMMLWTFDRPVQAEGRREQLARESISAARRTASKPPTPWQVMEKVAEACGLIQEKGESAFADFHGKRSAFIFSGTYIWVHTLHDSRMLFHPINPSLEGKQWLYQRDIKGKFYFAEFNEVAKNKNGGWVEYYWPKPGESDPLIKTTYVKKCVHLGVEYVVACGIYGISKKELLQRMSSGNGNDQP